MEHYCEYCNHYSKSLSNFINHKKTKKHLTNLDTNQSKTSKALADTSSNIAQTSPTGYVKLAETTILESKKFVCNNCNLELKHESSYYRHKKKCKHDNLINKIEILEKEKEFLRKSESEKADMLKEKTEMLNNFMANANVLLNKANDNTKITAQAMQTVSVSALKYANDKFKYAPALLPLENFNINNLNFDNEDDKEQLIETLIYHAKYKSLDKLLGNHIIKEYKKENSADQSFHVTDCSRLNYIVRELIENALIWSVDKSGIKICSSIVKPLIKKCITTLLEHQKKLLKEMSSNGNFNKQKEVELIIDVIISIDS